MEVCALLLLLLIPGTQTQQDLRSKVFIFPGGSSSDYVILTPNITRPLENVTVCVNHFSDAIGRYPIFSLATPGKDDAFVISRDATTNIYYVYINAISVAFRTDAVGVDWLYPCVSWESRTGVVRLWANRKVYPRKVVATGSSIAPNASIVLGQLQRSVGRTNHYIQSFAGEMFDVNMWDSAFTWDDISRLQWNGDYSGNVISWRDLRYQIKGNVLLQ